MITVVGCDGGPLAPAAREALDAAACVAGAPRHLDAVPVPAAARRIQLGALEPTLDDVLSCAGPAVVVASGDPGFFGIVRALRARGVSPRVVPAVSSVAMAFARLGLPWDDALVLSAHGRDPQRVLAAALAHPKVAILTARRGAGPDRFVGELRAAGRRVVVAERLGAADERLVEIAGDGAAGRAAAAVGDVAEGSTADPAGVSALGSGAPAADSAGSADSADWADWPGGFAHPNVVVAVDGQRAVAEDPRWLAGHRGAPDGWALPEVAFDHRESMITKAEVRALALARLAPRPGTIVWDVGAGSGSVAVECARFGAYALAFDKDPGQCARIRENAAVHGVHVGVVEGTVPESAGGQPGADAVFLGGGGAAALEALLTEDAPTRRVVAALAAVDKVRPVRDLLAGRGYVTGGSVVQTSRLGDLPGDAIRLRAENPVFVVWGERG